MTTEADGSTAARATVRWWAASLVWVAAVAAAYAGLFAALGETFTIEPTAESLARADRGRAVAGLLAVVVAALALVPVLRRSRLPRAAAAMVAGPGVAGALLSAADESGIVGLALLAVTSPLVLAGAVLGVLRDQPHPLERRWRVLVAVIACLAVALTVGVLSVLGA